MIRWLNLLLILIAAPAALATERNALQHFTPMQGQLTFTQTKHIQGLPVPLQSSGYLVLEGEDLLWHTTKPLDSKLLINPAGVSQWQEQQFVAVGGSEFVGQLMLAVLKQQDQFIAEHFAISELSKEQCITLTPTQAPLNTLFLHITLCGQGVLQKIELQEVNENNTVIHLAKDSALE